jgi:hypothetical protein
MSEPREYILGRHQPKRGGDDQGTEGDKIVPNAAPDKKREHSPQQGDNLRQFSLHGKTLAGFRESGNAEFRQAGLKSSGLRQAR